MASNQTIPFTKAHGAGNDFLLTWADRSPVTGSPEIARSICDRHTGIGADGWMLVAADAIRLFNADGSEPEISGNGTRCAAALLVDAGVAGGVAGESLTLMTGAGSKTLRLIERQGRKFLFEMDMGQPSFEQNHIRFPLPLPGRTQEVTIVNVGNPQCVVFVSEFPEDWRDLGRQMEAHSFFPKHTNVSFVRVLDEHTLEARFYERGVGPTVSSGTGATGAAVAAVLRSLVTSPVRVVTPAGDLVLRWDESVYLTGPAEITGAGEFFYSAQ